MFACSDILYEPTWYCLGNVCLLWHPVWTHLIFPGQCLLALTSCMNPPDIAWAMFACSDILYEPTWYFLGNVCLLWQPVWTHLIFPGQCLLALTACMNPPDISWAMFACSDSLYEPTLFPGQCLLDVPHQPEYYGISWAINIKLYYDHSEMTDIQLIFPLINICRWSSPTACMNAPDISWAMFACSDSLDQTFWSWRTAPDLNIGSQTINIKLYYIILEWQTVHLFLLINLKPQMSFQNDSSPQQIFRHVDNWFGGVSPRMHTECENSAKTIIM